MSLVGYDDEYDIHRVSRQRARKTYRCDECSGSINPGDNYRRDFMVYCGDADTHICCSDCDELSKKFFEALPPEEKCELTYEFGSLRKAVIELRDEFGVLIDGFEYPSADVIQFPGNDKLI